MLGQEKILNEDSLEIIDEEACGGEPATTGEVSVETSVEDPWTRVEQVAHWAGVKVHGLAVDAGMRCGQSLYQIKQGRRGVSRGMAEAICSSHPDLDKLWLLTGEGSMFRTPSAEAGFPCFNVDMETLLPDLAKYTSDTCGRLPMARSCDLAVTVRSEFLQPDVPAGATAFLRRESVGDITDGLRYVVVHDRKVRLCRACRAAEAGDSGPTFLDCRAEGTVAPLRLADVRVVYRVLGYYTPIEMK